MAKKTTRGTETETDQEIVQSLNGGRRNSKITKEVTS